MNARGRCVGRRGAVGWRKCGLVLALLAVVACGGASTAAGSTGDQLLPDLRTLKPSEISAQYRPKGKRLLLRFSNTVANHGVGPIEIRAAPGDPVDCNGDGVVNDHLAVQRIYEDGSGASDNGYYDSGDTYVDTDPGSAGCKYYHPAHHHWHLTDFASYSLVREPSGRVVRSATKVSFCLLDTLRPYPSLLGSPETGRYSPTCTELDPQGISIGWADIYSSFLPGQSLDVTGLRRGRYCLRSRVDPKNHLEETDDTNNAAEHALFLHPRNRSITPLKGSCGT